MAQPAGGEYYVYTAARVGWPDPETGYYPGARHGKVDHHLACGRAYADLLHRQSHLPLTNITLLGIMTGRQVDQWVAATRDQRWTDAHQLLRATGVSPASAAAAHVSYPLSATGAVKAPDLWLHVLVNGTPSAIAVEVERTAKSNLRYQSLAEFYTGAVQANLLDQVIYIADAPRVARRVAAAFTAAGAVSPNLVGVQTVSTDWPFHIR